jgi:TM2 domain-containing membrane protein YozV
VLSVFLGGLGVDRFVIGDVGLGVAKLLLGWITFGIWPLIDIFFCYKKAKEKNFNKLMSIL